MNTPTRTCVQCGQPLPDQAKFCGQCGTVTAPGSVTPQASSGARTIPDPAPAGGSFSGGIPKTTMLGFAGIGTAAPGVPAAAPPAAAGAPRAPPASAPMAHKTMVGVAIPGIAPIAAGPASAPAPSGLPVQHKTMLGVAIPGIAPLGGTETGPAAMPPSSQGAAASLRRGAMQTVALPATYVPPPAPLADMPAPPRPRIVRQKGIPLATVALVTAGLLLVGGTVIALLWRSAPPITGQPSVAPDGKDVLHLQCDPKSCNDGTIAEIDGARATFASGSADLTLASPLHVGDNMLSIHVDRPGIGRDETVALVVAVAYRVRADVSTMSAPRPSITIRVEAQPGTDVRIADNPVTLGAGGVGTYTVDESAATDGSADESRVLSLDLPYAVTPKGRAAEKGTVSARVAVAPLRVDAPGTRGVIEEDSVLVAGRAAKSSTVTIDGAPVTVAADGSFETRLAVDAPGERTFLVRASTTTLVPRTVRVALQRVASLADAAQAFEQQSPIGYDAAMSDLASKIGQPIVVDGDVLESRGSGHRTLVLVDDKRGCSKGPCLARVVVGRDLALARGDRLRFFGRVARIFTTSSAQTVPEVEADFVLRAKR